jgi:trehalose/maltose hydrolase-like predicted phosphorylase
MVSWMLSKAEVLMDDFASKGISEVLGNLGVSEENFTLWKDIERKLCLNINKEGIIEHFEGYFSLAELDWDAYREKYGNIHRLDRILKAEGNSPDAFKISKQADLLMVFYNLGNDKVTEIIKKMGYVLPENYIRKNFDYYISRTSHGSTLSRLVHARLAFKAGLFDTGWKLYSEALESDLNDIQGGTTGEGIHCGVMAGTIYDTMVAFAGLDLSGDMPVLNPSLPKGWKELQFKFAYKEDVFEVTISGSELRIIFSESKKTKIKLHICGKEQVLEKGKAIEVHCS